MPEDNKDLTVGHAAVFPDAPPSPPPEPPKPEGRGINLGDLVENVRKLRDEQEQTAKDRVRFKADMEKHVQESVKKTLKDVEEVGEKLKLDFCELRAELGKSLNAAYAVRLKTCEDKLDSALRKLDTLKESAHKAVESAEAALKANSILTARQNAVDDMLKKFSAYIGTLEKTMDDKLRAFKTDMVKAVDEVVATVNPKKRR